MLVFLPGFMSSPRDYDALLAPIRASGEEVVVPRLYGAWEGLSGRYTAVDEGRDAAAQARELGGAGRAVWLAGHSRGGQAAWRAAQLLGDDCAGLMLVDPVDGGGGPRPAERTSTAGEVHLDCPVLVIGAGRGGRCAPAAVNHDAFAEAWPAATHVVIADMGHADMLSGNALRLGRLLCGGGSDPAAAREEVSRLMLEFMAAA